MFLITNFFIALSLGTQRAQLVQRTNLTCPRPCLDRPQLRLFCVYTKRKYTLEGNVFTCKGRISTYSNTRLNKYQIKTWFIFWIPIAQGTISLCISRLELHPNTKPSQQMLNNTSSFSFNAKTHSDISYFLPIFCICLL